MNRLFSSPLVMAGVLAVYIATRMALYLTSFDAHIFPGENLLLFSAVDLAERGLQYALEYQTNLNHGVSTVQVALLVPVIALFGANLFTIKIFAMVWSGLTLMSGMWVADKYLSRHAALLWGICFVFLSPTSMRLDITLTGAEHEALLPVIFLIASYLAWLGNWGRRKPAKAGLAFGFGVLSSLSIWFSYSAAVIVLPLLVFRVFRYRRGEALALISGLALGAVPWALQNFLIYPDALEAWARDVASYRLDIDGKRANWAAPLADMVRSFGFTGEIGARTPTILAMAWAGLGLAVFAADRGRRMRAFYEFGPFVAMPVLALLWYPRMVVPGEMGPVYMDERFYVVVHFAMFWILTLALTRTPANWFPIARRLVSVALVAIGCVALSARIGTGSNYEPNTNADLSVGCRLFGQNVAARSMDAVLGAQRVSAISSDDCRMDAARGFARESALNYLRFGRPAELAAAVEGFPAKPVRATVCREIRTFLAHPPGRPLSAPATRRADGALAGPCGSRSRMVAADDREQQSATAPPPYAAKDSAPSAPSTVGSIRELRAPAPLVLPGEKGGAASPAAPGS